MKKPTEHEELLADVFADSQQCRTETLERGLGALRRARAIRRTARLMVSVAVPVVIVAVVLTTQHRRTRKLREAHQIAASPAHVVKTIEGTPIRVISDEELLDLFKGRPVALAGKPGEQRLILLDEKRN
jgi:hypothetical protein